MSLDKLMATAKKLCRSLGLVLLIAATSSAYTVVMHGGRRVEIPSNFALTATTLTYEVSPGIQITLLVTAIDIAATERANNEPAGSFLQRSEVFSGKSPVKTQKGEHTRPPVSAITVTNRDLQTYERTRRDSEVAYERRRGELGLPSLEESRRRAAAEAAAMDEMFEQKRSEQMQSESYWRARASALRSEVAAIDAQIGQVRVRLEEVSLTSATGSFAVLTSVLPFASSRSSFHRTTFRPGHSNMRPNIVVAPGAGVNLRAGVSFGGRVTRGRVLARSGTISHFGRHFGRHTDSGPTVSFWPNASVLSWPFQSYDFSYERTALVTRLDELLALRAGLDARWRVMEDEARRAGAPPGWLRP